MKKVLSILTMLFLSLSVEASQISFEKTGSLIDIPDEIRLINKKEYKSNSLDYISSYTYTTLNKDNYFILNTVESHEKSGSLSPLSEEGLKKLSRLDMFKLKEGILQSLVNSFNHNEKYTEVRLGNPDLIKINGKNFITVVGKAKMNNKEVKIIALLTGFNSYNLNLTFNYYDNPYNDDMARKIGQSLKLNIFKK